MRVTLTHISAAYQWLMTPIDGRELDELAHHGTLGSCPAHVRDLERFDLCKYEVHGLRTELLTTDSSSMPARGHFRYHCSGRAYPAGAFVLVDAGIQIVSPELSFWQMAKILSLGELVKYGDALCGKYSFSVDSDGRNLKRRVPLTTIGQLEAFANAMGKERGNPNAFKALRYIVEGSESPMESCVEVLLCLKRQYGGFGFIRPVMGHVVELDEVGRGLTGTATCRCDMFWPEASYDLEYDSCQEHSGILSAEHDSLRRTAIRHMGITVGELRKSQVTDADAFETAARLLAKDLKFRIPKRGPELEFKYSLAYRDLRRQLFWWEREHAGQMPSPLHVGELIW